MAWREEESSRRERCAKSGTGMREVGKIAAGAKESIWFEKQEMTAPGVEPGLSRPQRDALTTRRCGLDTSPPRCHVAGSIRPKPWQARRALTRVDKGHAYREANNKFRHRDSNPGRSGEG